MKFDMKRMQEDLGSGTIFPLGKENPFGEFFEGQSYLHMLAQEGLSVANVTFAPGCTNHWHRHINGGQILLCTGGRGYYQEWGKEPRELRAGDVVSIGSEKHWHGASPNCWFSHIAIEIPGKDAKTEWQEAVNPEEYNELK
ncbi:MAG: cupin domain-containing protein [Bacillota bacterium]|jgi:quercetin dioxygenase-like cupin family protein